MIELRRFIPRSTLIILTIGSYYIHHLFKLSVKDAASQASGQRHACMSNSTTTTPPQFDAVMFQAIVTTVVAEAMTQVNSSGASGARTGTNSNHGESQPRTQECTYNDFISCKPEFFNGTGGIIALSQWIERTEAIFEMCSCPEGSKIKFVACTFTKRALTWWNDHVQSVSRVAANAMGWETLKDLMPNEYYPRGEVQKHEEEF